MNIFQQTSNQLKLKAIENEAVLVSFSGGKDSLVVLDLCCKAFRKVVGFFLYLIPHLSVIEKRLDYARERWHVEILQYPHYYLPRIFINEVYCPKSHVFDDLREIKPNDLYKIIRADAGIDLIATGAKDADSFWRRRNLSTTQKYMFTPIRLWRKLDVLAYLRANAIPIPDGTHTTATGIDMSAVSLLWLHDHYPDDFDKLEEYFPYVRAVVKRREWYGIGY